MHRRLRNLTLGLLVGITIFLVSMWYNTVPLVLTIFSDTQTPTVAGYKIVGGLLAGAFADSSAVNTFYLALVGILIGLNVFLLLEVAQRRRPSAKGARGTVGLLGGIVALLGIGCAACGSLLGSTALAVFGLGGLLSLLPMQGQELRFIGLALLALSAYLTWRALRNPAVCSA